MKKDITSLFCFVDDFTKGIQEEIKRQSLPLHESTKKPTRTPDLTESEIVTIILMLLRNGPCLFKIGP